MILPYNQIVKEMLAAHVNKSIQTVVSS